MSSIQLREGPSHDFNTKSIGSGWAGCLGRVGDFGSRGWWGSGSGGTRSAIARRVAADNEGWPRHTVSTSLRYAGARDRPRLRPRRHSPLVGGPVVVLAAARPAGPAAIGVPPLHHRILRQQL